MKIVLIENIVFIFLYPFLFLRQLDLNIYSKKQRWKLFLVIAALIIGVLSLWYTNILVKKLSEEERKKVELWAKGQQELGSGETDQDISFIFEVIKNNETVPVILVDEKDSIINHRNLNSAKDNDLDYLRSVLESMKKHKEPIEITIFGGIKQYIYYSDSILLTRLYYYPYIQLIVFFLFILVAYFAFSSSRKAEQNQIWVGMSKETAHQLGTPISSMIAWLEILKEKHPEDDSIKELFKDISRLEVITDRFSKIGSSPALNKQNILIAINKTITYIKSRSPEKIQFNIHAHEREEIFVPLNEQLFAWVIENVAKNAIDAMNGEGVFEITISDQNQVVFIDLKDTGKGIQKSKYKTIFQPGYTTKERGWGLGLSLAKRIVEVYHSGKIFVKSSEMSQGSTIRIALKK